MRDHSFSTYAKFSEKTHYVCVSGGKKCKFFGNFAYVLNEWSLSDI